MAHGLDLLDYGVRDLQLAPELHSVRLRLGDAVQLPLPSDVVLELRNQRKNAEQ